MEQSWNNPGTKNPKIRAIIVSEKNGNIYIAFIQHIFFAKASGHSPVFLFAGIPPAERIPPMRSDRTPGNRAAFEAAKQKVLKTQDTCGICGLPVDMSLKYPHPMSPTVDHIIPIAKGGHPSDINNLQLAHRHCNRQKSDKIVAIPKEKNERIGNRDLPLHNDWKNYKS